MAQKYQSLVPHEDAVHQFNDVLRSRRCNDLNWLLSLSRTKQVGYTHYDGLFLLSICTTIDCLGGTVYGFRKLDDKGKIVLNVAERFKDASKNLLNTTAEEADFLWDAVRNGIIHGGVPQMLGSWIVSENPASPNVFVTRTTNNEICLYIGSLANRLILAIDHVAHNTSLITDRPGEGDS